MERDVELWLGQQIEHLGGLYWKLVSPGTAGVPDRIAVMPGGKVIFIELKDDYGRLRKLQIYQLEKLRRRGQKVRVVKGKEDAVRFVQELRRNYGIHTAPLSGKSDQESDTAEQDRAVSGYGLR